MSVLTIKIFSLNFVMVVLLTGNQMFKIKKCITLHFRNPEMQSGIYVASYQRKYFLINFLNKNELVKSPHHADEFK